MAEPCAMCSGTGRRKTTWDFGASVVDTCSFCGGSGVIKASDLHRSPTIAKTSGSQLSKIIEAAMEQYRDEIKELIFKPSPLASLLEKKIQEAEKRIKDQMETTLFAPDIGKTLFRQEFPPSEPAV